MSENKYSGNFYHKDDTKEQEKIDDCPNCIYQQKQVNDQTEDCLNCYYIPKKNQNQGEEKKQEKDPK